jgi:hypothetical protein
MADKAYQLPEDIGQKSISRNGEEVQAASEFPSGQALKEKSLPVVMPRNGYTLPIIDNYRAPTQVDRDLLGFPRATTPYNFLTQNDAYELTEADWIYDVTGIDERPDVDSTESARWMQIAKAKPIYFPAPYGEVKYNPSASSAQLILNSANGGFQRARVCTKKRYRYQPGRIVRVSLACRMSLDDTPISVTRLWGVGDPNDGFFVEAKGDGEGDRLQILYRTSSGSGLRYETRIPRSQWTGDKVDGSGKSGQKLDLTKTFMTLIEWGWYGASNVRIYFYLVDNNKDLPTSITQIPRARWILAHELILSDRAKRNDLKESDGAGGLRTYDAPSLRRPGLPVWVEIANSGNLARSEFIERYGASVIVDGGDENKAKVATVDAVNGIPADPAIGGTTHGAGRALLTLRSRPFLTNNDNALVENLLVTKPLKLSATASALVELEIWKDPIMVKPENTGHINGQLPYRDGDYVSPFNMVPEVLTSYDSAGTEIALSDATPVNNTLAVTTTYTGRTVTLDLSLNDHRLVVGGRKIGSYMVDAKGLSLNLEEIFSGQRETITSEFDSPPDFPIRTTSIEVRAFNSVTGEISVSRAFPLRLYPNQRVSLGSTNYYVLAITSSTTFTLKAAKVNTTAVTAGILAGDTLVAHYEADLSGAVATQLTPIYNTELVFVAKPFMALPERPQPSVDENAQWMNPVNATTDNTFTPLSVPTVDLYITHGVV